MLLAIFFALISALVSTFPPSATRADGTLIGAVPPPGGAGLVGWVGGGRPEDIAAAAAVQGCQARAVWVANAGSLIGFVVGAPNFVNSSFTSTFPDGFRAALTPLLLVCGDSAPPPVSPVPLRACATPLAVPPALRLDSFYAKYADASGIPIVSSRAVPDQAFCAAYDVVTNMLVNRPDVRAAMIANGARVAIMARSEVTTDIPEHRDLYSAFPGTDWNTRARGLAGTLARPATSGAEENLLCYADDPYRGESILVHEFGHAVFTLGLSALPDGTSFRQQLDTAYALAIAVGKWRGTYAASNVDEYWAEGVQDWFDTNLSAVPANGIHNEIRTRAQVKAYDPALAALLDRAFGAASWTPSCPSGSRGSIVDLPQ